MTQNKARKRAARRHAAETGDSYTRALRQVAASEPAPAWPQLLGRLTTEAADGDGETGERAVCVQVRDSYGRLELLLGRTADGGWSTYRVLRGPDGWTVSKRTAAVTRPWQRVGDVEVLGPDAQWWQLTPGFEYRIRWDIEAGAYGVYALPETPCEVPDQVTQQPCEWPAAGTLVRNRDGHVQAVCSRKQHLPGLLGTGPFADGALYGDRVGWGNVRPLGAPEPQHHVFRPTSWSTETCAVAGCLQDRVAPVHQIGGLVPPVGWSTGRYPAMLSTCRDGTSGQRVVEVLDAATGTRITGTSVPWRPAEDLVAEYETAGLMPHPESSIGAEKLIRVRLGRPDLVGHQLGYDDGVSWSQWPDGSWRAPARPLGRRHLVTATPLRPNTRDIGAITIREYPGGHVVVDELVDPVDPDDTSALARVLDRFGYTVASGSWESLPGGVRYAPALPGHLAERDWWTLARVRIVKETTVGAVDPMTSRTYRIGEEVTMNQSGQAGREVLRDTWWSSTDIDGAYVIDADCAEVVEVLEDHPPTWDAAALTAAQITELLAPHHPGAADAAEAWIAAGLHVAHTHGGLAVRTPAPERRLVGRIGRDYWNGNQFTKPYEVVLDEASEWLNQPLAELPLEPVTAALTPPAAPGRANP